MSYHFYADDSQIYMSFQLLRPGEPEHSKSKVEACILDINKWMTANKLMLNNDKTELLVLNARHRPPPPLSSIYAGSELIIAAESAKNIGVWFDNTLSMNRQVNSLCKTAFYHLRNLATIRKFLSHKNCEILIHAFVTCRIDYCNSLLSGLPQHMLQKDARHRGVRTQFLSGAYSVLNSVKIWIQSAIRGKKKLKDGI